MSSGRCSVCGSRVSRHTTSADAIRCLACRRRPQLAVVWVSVASFVGCQHCGQLMPVRRGPGRRRRYCGNCVPPPSLSNVSAQADRRSRSVRAPGLTESARRLLLRRWRRQGRRCVYCPAACETVDHVIPLARGGTNYEGNLVPACRRCNGRKSHRTIMEWRLDRNPRRMRRSPVPPVQPKPARRRQSTQLAIPLTDCPVCGSSFMPTATNARYCSKGCQVEREARRQRDAYRAEHGIPFDPDEPTRMFGRREVDRGAA